MNKVVKFDGVKYPNTKVSGPLNIQPGGLILHNKGEVTSTVIISIEQDSKSAALHQVQLRAGETYSNDQEFIIPTGTRLIFELTIEIPPKDFTYYIVSQPIE